MRVCTVQYKCVCLLKEVEGDIISTFTREQPSIHLKAPGGQSPAQTHAAALLWAHANTHTHTLDTAQLDICATDFDVTNMERIFFSLLQTYTLWRRALFRAQISELIGAVEQR